MKKFVLICLALVLALGSLGVGYAMWSDTVTVAGPVSTGSACLEFEKWWVGGPYIREEVTTTGKDLNWTDWIAGPGPSCPPNGKFDGVVLETKDIGKLGTVTPHIDGDGHCYKLDVNIDKAYPYYYILLTVKVRNCGTIPLILQTPVFSQHDSLRIEYWDGHQIEPNQSQEVSFAVGVTQHIDDTGSGDEDPNDPWTPQGATLNFTIDIDGLQWAK